jgi:hypothetical protein
MIPYFQCGGAACRSGISISFYRRLIDGCGKTEDSRKCWILWYGYQKAVVSVNGIFEHGGYTLALSAGQGLRAALDPFE